MLVSNLMKEIKYPNDIINFNIPKVITDRNNYRIYLTRSAVPFQIVNLIIDFINRFLCIDLS